MSRTSVLRARGPAGLVRIGLASLSLALLAACSSPRVVNSTVGLGVAALGNSPTTNIVQTYYLGVFDPREQLPPTIYRVRVQGQANALAWTKFASGWVRADLVDSLSGRVDMERNGIRLADSAPAPAGTASGAAGGGLRAEDKGALNRRLVMFGPEGFREAPKDHRLVVVMGSNPAGFFGAVDRALGQLAAVTQPRSGGPDVVRELWTDMARLREERRAVQTLLDSASRE